MLRKSKGNMYDFTDYQWNPIKGKCEFDCVYCYMKRFGHLKPPRLVEKEFKEFETDIKNVEKPVTIFVGSSIDMFAKSIPGEWINRVLKFCCQYDNTYLFQSKNPARFLDFNFPADTIFGTTIESNRDHEGISKAPCIYDRIQAMIELRHQKYRTMVTIEPVLEFNVFEMVDILRVIKPEWINLGADSGGNKLPEPSKEKLLELMDKIDIRQKPNLKRLLK